MITDNLIYPKTYEATKLMDTFPLGTLKVTLGQSHYNEHTDLCKKICIEEIGDTEEVMHMICDYYKSSLPPIVNKDKEETTWKLQPTTDKIRVNEEIQIAAISNVNNPIPCQWSVKVDNVQYEFNDLLGYIEFSFVESPNTNTNILSVKVINDVMIDYIIKIIIQDENRTYYDSVEMEVIDG